MGHRKQGEDDLLERVKRRLETSERGKGRGRLSPLTRLVRSRLPEFEALVRDRSWEAVAEALAAEGVLDGNGRPPTAERVRKTYWLERQRAAAQTGTMLQKPMSGQTPGVRPAEQVSHEAPTRRKFGFVRPKDWSKGKGEADE